MPATWQGETIERSRKLITGSINFLLILVFERFLITRMTPAAVAIWQQYHFTVP
jgi:hypothetical protein